MTRLVAHRGPDGEGFLALGGASLHEVPVSASGVRVALGHRRLSIVDLSDGARQPMQRGALSLTYNGEIFNYVEVRETLASLGHHFTTSSDTEVLLAAWQQWGPGCLERLRGMWGFVLVDAAARRAWLCRDRLGIKPLYVQEQRGVVAVASEIKQFGAHGTLDADDDSVGMYLQTGYEDGARSFFRGVTPLAPGTWQSLDLDTGVLGPVTPYWHPERVQQDVADADEAAERFAAVFRESVRIHLRSDVPVGCALSGGLDSSAIAAVVAEEGKASGARLETFSATFPGFHLDESRYVDTVVRATSATPHAVRPTAADLLSDLDRFLWCHDEPVGSLSQYAAYAVARLTRNARVPVTLNGQGGDELLGGYWQTTFASLAAERHAPLRLARQILPALLPGGNREMFWQAPGMLRRYATRRDPAAHVRLRRAIAADASPAHHVLALDDGARRLFALRDLTLPRLLKWDDRNFMAFGVEGRYPFLDHHVMETCLSFRSQALFVAGWTKEPLRRAMRGHLPESIVRRRGKVGFETPQDVWLRGALGDTVRRTLAGDTPVLRYMERDAIAAVVAGAHKSREGSQALVRLFLVDRWARGKGLVA